jgi:hypothetical protein
MVELLPVTIIARTLLWVLLGWILYERLSRPLRVEQIESLTRPAQAGEG